MVSKHIKWTLPAVLVVAVASLYPLNKYVEYREYRERHDGLISEIRHYDQQGEIDRDKQDLNKIVEKCISADYDYECLIEEGVVYSGFGKLEPFQISSDYSVAAWWKTHYKTEEGQFIYRMGAQSLLVDSDGRVITEFGQNIIKKPDEIYIQLGAHVFKSKGPDKKEFMQDPELRDGFEIREGNLYLIALEGQQK